MGRTLEIFNFRHIGQGDIQAVGGKAASLGELTQAGLPVPPGFVIAASAYQTFLRGSGFEPALTRMVAALTPDSNQSLTAAARKIQRHLLSVPFPRALRVEIERAYRELIQHQGRGLAVAVRPSLVARDAPETNFAGQLETYLNVVGADAICRAVQQTWASVFEARAIHYRLLHKINQATLQVPVVVQSMVQAQKSGVMFTANPLTGGQGEIVIEAVFGLGEVLVRGALTPDRYVLAKEGEKVLEMTVAAQPWQLVRVGTKTGARLAHRAIPKTDQRQQKLSFAELQTLRSLAKAIENHYHYPQNVEWAIDEAGAVWLLESWPLAIHQKIEDTPPRPLASEGQGRQKSAETMTLSVDPKAKILAKGMPGSMGLVSGPVRVIHHPRQMDEVTAGEILVTEQTSPAYAPAMHRAAAIVTDTGGTTSHAVVLSREIGIPCVVGTGTATSHLKNGLIVTVDGRTGLVYQGKVTAALSSLTTNDQRPTTASEMPLTATKVMINLAEPKRAIEYSQLPVDGVGLLRAEFMIAGMGVHPRYLLKEKKDHLFVRKLTEGIRTIAHAFAPRPVIYRASDFKTNEYRLLTGGAKVEPREENPMLGYRGALRYLREPDVFQLELGALRQVRDSYNLTNVQLMLPFVRTVEELASVRELVGQSGLLDDRGFQLWMMVEVPSNVLLLEEFLAQGVHGVSIGSNDLTQLILGIDRDNARLASAFDERNPAVMQAMEYVVKTCRKYHVAVSICGQAASVYPEITEALIEAGVTSVSVNADVAVATRQLIASIERRLLLDQLTRSAHGERHPLWSVVPVSHH